jgi:hypothetical protein
MGISIDRAKRHVEENCSALKMFAQNANWPKYLFHAAHAETAAKILISGALSPRSLLGHIDHDVANQGALNNNNLAHDYCRLYFRNCSRCWRVLSIQATAKDPATRWRMAVQAD